MLRINTTFDCFFLQSVLICRDLKLKTVWVFANDFFLILHDKTALWWDLSFRDGDQVHQSVHFPDYAASQHSLHTLYALSDSQFLKKKCTISFRRLSQSNIMEFVLKKYHPLVWNFPLQFFLCPFFTTSNTLSSFLVFLSFWCLLTIALSFPHWSVHSTSSSLATWRKSGKGLIITEIKVIYRV